MTKNKVEVIAQRLRIKRNQKVRIGDRRRGTYVRWMCDEGSGWEKE